MKLCFPPLPAPLPPPLQLMWIPPGFGLILLSLGKPTWAPTCLSLANQAPTLPLFTPAVLPLFPLPVHQP